MRVVERDYKHIDMNYVYAQMAFYYLIKLVWFPLSVSGSATPAALPASKHLIIHARFLARFLMVLKCLKLRYHYTLVSGTFFVRPKKRYHASPAFLYLHHLL